MGSRSLQLDVLVHGGGVAGLWTLRALGRAGFRAALLSQGDLGAGQTIASQGIIHGGIKYALGGAASSASRAIAAMPERWTACLHGRGEVDLRGVRVLSPCQYLWTTGGMGSRLMGVAASKAIRTPVKRLPAHERGAAFEGAEGIDVYSVDEMVLEPRSLVGALAEGQAVLDAARAPELAIDAGAHVWCAGPGNGPERMQIRPLHMLMCRSATGARPLPMLYGHCLSGGISDKPRITITSQHDAAGRVVWYVGGQIAERGVGLGREELIDQARRELAACVGWVDLGGTEFATLRVDRAEGLTPGGDRPDEPVVMVEGDRVRVWPTKLAFAPLAAERAVEAVREMGVRASGWSEGLVEFLGLGGRPGVAPLPWDAEGVSWT